ncbi:hypothetical protein HT118_13900 [Escherichia coli]|nr:hypothetical protein [Escherichia coli]
MPPQVTRLLLLILMVRQLNGQCKNDGSAQAIMREDDKVYIANITNKTATKGAELSASDLKALATTTIIQIRRSFGKS